MRSAAGPTAHTATDSRHTVDVGFLLGAVGVLCVIGGLALAAVPVRVLRLDPQTPHSRELRAVRGTGLVLMGIGAFLVALSLTPQRPLLPSPPTPTPIRRIL